MKLGYNVLGYNAGLLGPRKAKIAQTNLRIFKDILSSAQIFPHRPVNVLFSQTCFSTFFQVPKPQLKLSFGGTSTLKIVL